MTLTAPDLLEQLGLDDFVHCDAKECEIRATWWLVCRGCNHHGALCAAHRANLDRLPSIEIGRPRMFGLKRDVYLNLLECERCLTQVPAGSWRSLFYLVPIVD